MMRRVSKSPERQVIAIRVLVPEPDPLCGFSGKESAERKHQSVQSRLRRRYRTMRCEVSLVASIAVDDREIIVEGRLDGYRRTRRGISICEIKPVSGASKEWIGQPRLRGALRQLILYMDLAARTPLPPWGKLPVADGELLLAGTDGSLSCEKIDPPRAHGALERRLRAFFSIHTERDKRPDLSLLEQFVSRDSVFDRVTQTEAAARLNESASSRILLSMPPGSGKTRIAFRHAIRQAVCAELPLCWITIKSRGRDTVVEETERFHRAAVPLRVLWKTAADRICTCGYSKESCPVRFDTEEQLFWEGLPHALPPGGWTVDDVLRFASERSLCSYELARFLEPLADVLIADVNYLIGPSSLRGQKAVIVLDEAQNLSRRIRDYYQASLTTEDIRELRHRASPSERDKLRSLFPDRFSGIEHEVDAKQWLRFLEALSVRDALSDCESAFLRLLRLWEQFPNDVCFAWYRGEGSPMLLGTPVFMNRILDAALASFPFVMALSGSLPADESVRNALFPAGESFECIETTHTQRTPVYVCPILDFLYPISLSDHDTATKSLAKILEKFGGTIAVFGQNCASNEMMAMRLHVRGFTSLLDEDIRDDWSLLLTVKPDFLFSTLGGSLSESVNPPADVFSCAVVLAAGFAAPDPFTRLRQRHASQKAVDMADEPAETALETLAETVSRIIQSVGRVQRDPLEMKPAFLLARQHATRPFMRAWPKHWISDDHRDLLCNNLNEALERAARK